MYMCKFTKDVVVGRRRRVHVRHGVHVDVEEAVERHKLRRVLVVGRQLCHKVVLESGAPEP